MTRPRVAEWSSKDKLILLQGWAIDGLTMQDIANNIGINKSTLYDWMKKSPNIANVLKIGREQADQIIVNALFNKAKGGDVTAMIFWLKNRQPKKWRDRQDVNMEANVSNTIREDLRGMSNEELEKRAKLLKKDSD